ncbi:hypothetical protein DJ031_00100, partial [bacterium endosymbiont of Escarpia laminata]
LLGNSSYGKTITRVDRHRDIKYATPIGASPLVNNRRFRQLDVVVDDELYEVALNKRTVVYGLPIQIGYFVYQYAKLRMLEFYYDFVDAYIPRPLFQYCAMDTDSAYIALAGRDIDALVPEAWREHYFRNRSLWFPAECCDAHVDAYVRCRVAGLAWEGGDCCARRCLFDRRTPGLFKEEWRGDGIVALCSKTYYCFGGDDGAKYSTKGLSKRQNADIDENTFLAVLRDRRSGVGWNRGFQVKDSSVLTYVQERAALSYFYAKRRVLDDGVTTAPILV